MKELVQANMLEFIDELTRFLADRQFTYHDERGASHPGVYLRKPPTLQVNTDGFLYTSVDMGGIVTSFSTYTLKEGGHLITDSEFASRMWFTFADKILARRMLTVRTHFPHLSMQGHSTVRRFVVGN